jgi:hypothetical protein
LNVLQRYEENEAHKNPFTDFNAIRPKKSSLSAVANSGAAEVVYNNTTLQHLE